MTPTFVRVLTPPGSAAVAVVALHGPQAETLVRTYFRRANGQALGATLPSGFSYGRFGTDTADEVVLRIRSATEFEIHAHGGPQVVAWLMGLLREHGCVEERPDPNDPWYVLTQTRTTRTAALVLAQCHGAYANAMAQIAAGATALRAVLRRNANVGRHLVEPWRVVLAGLPNAGKSSLLNALAGYARSIVSPRPGTTRDAVTVTLAFDGWPVELVDTAGLRDTPDLLEREGVARTKAAVAQADLCVWLHDATTPAPQADELRTQLALPPERFLWVNNKTDLAPATHGLGIAATTGAGLADLLAAIVQRLVPYAPLPGEPVPYTPELCARAEQECNKPSQ